MSEFERELYSRAERLSTVERMNWSLEERAESFPPTHVENIYQELRLEVANGATVEEAHEIVFAAIQKRMKPSRARSN